MRGSRNFFQGGGGVVQARRPENSLDNFFFFFLVLNLFYSLQRASNGFITEKTILSKDPEGSNIFKRGGPTFSTGDQMLISLETHKTCDFPGGPDHLSPLWIRTWFLLNLKVFLLTFQIENFGSLFFF